MKTLTTDQWNCNMGTSKLCKLWLQGKDDWFAAERTRHVTRQLSYHMPEHATNRVGYGPCRPTSLHHLPCGSLWTMQTCVSLSSRSCRLGAQGSFSGQSSTMSQDWGHRHGQEATSGHSRYQQKSGIPSRGKAALFWYLNALFSVKRAGYFCKPH